MSSHVATRYASVVTAVGDIVESFREQGVLVFFGEGAPEELHDFSVLHRPDVTTGGVSVGDVVVLGDVRLPVTAIGAVADANLTALGHLDIKANGLSDAPLPGDVCVPEGDLPELLPGMRWSIEAGTSDAP